MRQQVIDLIKAERREQVEKHGFSKERDAAYRNNELVLVARTILNKSDNLWPISWDFKWFEKFMSKDRRGQLIIAGALLLAHKEAFPKDWDTNLKNLFDKVVKDLEEIEETL